jgi:N-acetylglutamate synthase-like GNAT family acetyltransferase/protein-tyrosine-phosphatase
MAEGWTRALHGDRIEAYSAGTVPKPIDPTAIQVMREAGVEIAAQRSKDVAELAGITFDRVVTVCDNAREACPVFLGPSPKLHAGFDDPPRLAQGLSPDEALTPYRRVRDEIRAFVERLPSILVVADRAPEPAEDRDLAGVLGLLESTDLPTVGVAEQFPAAYSVIRSGPKVIGAAGLESHGKSGLLRSVAVAGAYRGLGLGQRLVDDRLAFAKAHKIEAIYLLTTTAAPFFRTLGFEPTSRSDAPEELQSSSEFTSVCPATASCLVRRLQRIRTSPLSRIVDAQRRAPPRGRRGGGHESRG